MIEVLQVISDANIGGAGRWLLNVLNKYDKNSFNISVALPQNSMLIEPIEKYNIEIIEVPYMADKSFDIRAVLFFIKLFKKKKYDIIHTHAGFSARIGAKVCNSGKIIYSKHCIDNERNFKLKLSSYISSYFCDKIIAVSESAKECMVENAMPEDKIKVIYNGVERIGELTEDQKNKIRKKYYINDNELVVSIFARIEEIKGHDFFIEAAETLLKKYNLKFFIVGTGSKEDKLKQSVKDKGIEDSVIFTGYLKDITELMNITDINVVSSYSEALSLSIIECMSLGIPSVVTNTGGNTELVFEGINGVLVPVGDSQSIAEGIEKLVNDKELRKRMGFENKRIMEEKFTSITMTNDLEKFYKLIIHNEKD
jgi:glycosyltransferase involved in cell wall biosynthesis